MRRIDLDFRRPRRATPWLGRVLLVIAAVVCLDAAFTYQSVRKSIHEAEARAACQTPASGAPKATAQEVAAARETVQRIGLPWNELFLALETAASDTVALAAIEPDAAKGTVTISADGKSYLAALSYVSNLSRIEGLDRVQLVRHEQKANDPNGPVNFAVSAAWSTK
jgi:biopolymer transport protein ExbD